MHVLKILHNPTGSGHHVVVCPILEDYALTYLDFECTPSSWLAISVDEVYNALEQQIEGIRMSKRAAASCASISKAEAKRTRGHNRNRV
jgi:hypothetical protein